MYNKPFYDLNAKHERGNTVSENLHELSEAELAKLIGSAQKTLRDRQLDKRKEVVAEIKQLAASIGYSVELTEISPENATGSTRKGTKVPVKYRDPDNTKHQWTGRDVQPNWLRELIGQGRTLDEFRVA